MVNVSCDVAPVIIELTSTYSTKPSLFLANICVKELSFVILDKVKVLPVILLLTNKEPYIFCIKLIRYLILLILLLYHLY